MFKSTPVQNPQGRVAILSTLPGHNSRNSQTLSTGLPVLLQRVACTPRLCCNVHSLSFLLSSPIATKLLLKNVHSTGCFKLFFEAGNCNQYTNAKYVSDKHVGGCAFQQWIADPNTHEQFQLNHT